MLKGIGMGKSWGNDGVGGFILFGFCFVWVLWGGGGKKWKEKMVSYYGRV